MALVTKYYLVEQVRALLSGGSPGAGGRYEHRMIESHLQQMVNRHLKAEYFNVTLPGDETIPEGLVLTTYDAIPVERYKGLSRARLPAMPVALRRNMGVFFVGPSVIDAILDVPEITGEALTSASILLSWTFVNNATVYTLERDLAANFENAEVVYSGDAFSFTDTGLDQGTSYYYRIKATAPGYDDSAYAEVNIITRYPAILNEDGSYMLAENGAHILIESL